MSELSTSAGGDFFSGNLYVCVCVCVCVCVTKYPNISVIFQSMESGQIGLYYEETSVKVIAVNSCTGLERAHPPQEVDNNVVVPIPKQPTKRVMEDFVKQVINIFLIPIHDSGGHEGNKR